MSDDLEPIEVPAHLLCIGPAAREWVKDAAPAEGARRAELWLAELAAQERTIRGMRDVRVRTLRKTMTVRQTEAATGIGRSTISKIAPT